jgi:hypothetical protein
MKENDTDIKSRTANTVFMKGGLKVIISAMVILFNSSAKLNFCSLIFRPS